jgi:UDP:flavonoid glycosyltransferase YjiC (YdhE family)
MLLLPVGGDLAEDSAWCAQTGIARVLPPDQQSSLLIRQAVCDLLEDPGYRRRAAQFVKRCTNSPEWNTP